MAVVRYLRKRKKLLMLIIACVMCHFATRHLWKVGDRIPLQTLSGDDWLKAFIWNNKPVSSTAGITLYSPIEESTNDEPIIAIACAITSRKLSNVSERNVGEKFQFFHTFLPSFCHTASQRFVYAFYLAYDRSDRVFADRLRDAFRRQFHAAIASGDCGITIKNLSLVECDYTGKPSWAQNDAMLAAYLDHVDYLYRINDDTNMLTAGWTEKFISTLEGSDIFVN